MIGGKNHQQGIEGDSNQQAGGDIVNNINNIIYSAAPGARAQSAIERVLRGLYSIRKEPIEFFPSDTLPYTLEDKIDFNGIESYKQFYDDFLEGCALVKGQIEEQSKAAPECETALIHYVKSIYRQILSQYPADTSNEKINKICNLLSYELKQSEASLTPEEYRAVEYVVFYVFSECKIFNKPPSSHDSSK